MPSSGPFLSNKKFLALEHFPYGLARSGEFSREQVNLLENHGEAYQSLHSGLRQPSNREEQDFVSVCRGEKIPETAHEIAWSRFCEKSQKQIMPSIYSGKPQQSEDISTPTDDDW